MKILLVEDHPELCEWVAKSLRQSGYAVDIADCGEHAEHYLLTGEYDGVLLDLSLPGKDGLDVLRSLRARGSQVPVLIFTARGSVDDRIRGLNLGADDYLPKPFEPRELAARLQTILRRVRAAPAASPAVEVADTVAAAPTVMHFDGLSIDLARRQVQRQGEIVALTGTEFELLWMLAREPGRVWSRDDILNRLRGREADLYTRAVDILVSRLRRKLEPLQCIKTLRNAGYTFAAARLT